MPVELIHLEDADLDGRGVEPGLLAAFRAYLPSVLNERRELAERRGLTILAPASSGRLLLMVLARRIGAALRDANIDLREGGGDLKAGRQKLCYLPGGLLAEALDSPKARLALADEAACFVQDLDAAWMAEARARPRTDDRTAALVLEPPALLALLDERLAAGRPTFLTADPARLPPGLAAELRARFTTLE